MPNYLIGKENLPNVYIDRISILDSSINIELGMYDFSDVSESTWRHNTDMKDMKVLLVTTSNTDVMNLINLSGSSLLDFNRDEFILYATIGVNAFQEREVSNGIRKYQISIPSNKGLEESHLNAYACTMVPIDLFSNPQLNKYCGAVTGEKIFENGAVPSQSGYFYYPDTNEEYGGPVHFHSEEFMEGSRHRNITHKIVRYVPEDNTKIRDERQ